MSASDIARSAGVHVSQLFRWRKQLCDRAAPALIPVAVVPETAIPCSRSGKAVAEKLLQPPNPRTRNWSSSVKPGRSAPPKGFPFMLIAIQEAPSGNFFSSCFLTCS